MFDERVTCVPSGMSEYLMHTCVYDYIMVMMNSKLDQSFVRDKL